MALTIWQEFAQDSLGNAINSPVVTVRKDAVIADIFSDIAGLIPKANPFVGASNGYMVFYAEAGLYEIEIQSATGTTILPNAPIGTGQQHDVGADPEDLVTQENLSAATENLVDPTAQIDATVNGTVIIAAGTTALDFTGALSATKTIDCTDLIEAFPVPIYSVNGITAVTLSGAGLTFTGDLTTLAAGQSALLTRNGTAVHAAVVDGIAKVDEWDMTPAPITCAHPLGIDTSLGSRYSLDGPGQKLSLLASGPTTQSSGNVSTVSDFTVPAADGVYSIAVKARFDAMLAGGPSDQIGFDFSVVKSGTPFVLVQLIAYEDGTFKTNVFDDSMVFPVMYTTGTVSAAPEEVTLLLDTDTGTFGIKIGATTVSLAGNDSFTAGSGFSVVASCSHSGISAGVTADMEMLTSTSSMAHGEGKDICGNAIPSVAPAIPPLGATDGKVYRANPGGNFGGDTVPANSLVVFKSGLTAIDVYPEQAEVAAGDAATLAAANTYADGLVVGLWDDRGNYDASVNTFPASGGSGTAGAILKGDIWTTSVVGTLGGVDVGLGDTIRALVDTPAQTASNWAVAENNLGYAPQPLNANLTAESGLTGAADKISYYTGVGAKALVDFTAPGRALAGTIDCAWAAKPGSPTAGIRISVNDIARIPVALVGDGEHWVPENFMLGKAVFAYALRDNLSLSSGEGFSVISNGAGAGFSSPTTPPPAGSVWAGYLQAGTGTTSTGRAGVAQGNISAAALSPVFDTALGDLETTHVMALPALSDGTDRYTHGAGFRDSSGLSSITNGAYFTYTDNVNGGKWQCNTIAGGSAATPKDSGVTVAINTEYKLTVKLSPTAARFYINGTLVQTMTTNLPTGPTQRTASMAMTEKSVGAAPALTLLDYHESMQFLINPRS